MKQLYFLFFALSIGFAQVPKVWWVDGINGNDNNNGQSEATAFKSIQTVFTNNYLSAYNDTIYVKEGTYDFKDDNVQTSAGFVLVGVSGAEKTIFDAGSTNRHFYLFVYFSDRDKGRKQKFEGISFINGYNDGEGGSIISQQYNDIYFDACIFENNEAKNYGGAIESWGSIEINGTTFKNNKVLTTTGSNEGGALRLSNTSNAPNAVAIIKNSKFIGNSAQAYRNAQGGAIKIDITADIINTTFINNYTLSGVNNDFTMSYSDSRGGALYIYATSYINYESIPETVRIINSTFDGNYVDSDLETLPGEINAASILVSEGKVYMFNSSITNSHVKHKGDIYTGIYPIQLYQDYDENDKVIHISGGSFAAEYSNIQSYKNQQWGGTYLYDTSPGFKDPANGDFSLSDKSPLIGQGSATWSDLNYTAPDKDILGNPRPSPSGTAPDIGAYENANSVTDAPMPARNFVAKAISYGAQLSWSPSRKTISSNENADNIQYQVYVDGKNFAQTSDTVFVVKGLTLDQTYSIYLTAKNTSTSKESVASSTYNVTPQYLGPWYVAVSGGLTPEEGANQKEYGSATYPINNLTNALNVVSEGDTIVMMSGTHKGLLNRNIELKDKRIVITGDLSQGPEATIIDAESKGRHFTITASDYNNTIDTTMVIQNITLKNGKTTALGTQWDEGGGSIRVFNNTRPKLYNIIFDSNIDENSDTEEYLTRVMAGAVLVTNSGKVHIISCQFINNKSIANSSVAGAGAVYISDSYGSNVSIIDGSIFYSNESIGKRGAWGAALYSQGRVDVTNSVFYNNTATTSDGGVAEVIRYSDIYVDELNLNKTYSIFANNTVANNAAISSDDINKTHGLFYYSYVDPNRESHSLYIFNNIFYGKNSSDENTPLVLADIGNVYLDHNIIQDKDQVELSRDDWTFDNSYDFDPMFKDTANGDYFLSDQSLALGKGVSLWEINNLQFYAPTKDARGRKRPSPSGSNPDLGAYENSLSESPYPPKVKGLVAKGGSNRVVLNWEAMAEADSVYKIYQSDQAFSTLSANTYIGNTTNTTFTSFGLDNAKRYYFKVTGVNKQGYEGAPASIAISPTHTGPIWWLATDGNDANDGSIGGPLATLHKAMEKAASGDTIMLKPGTYYFRDMEYPSEVGNPISGYSRKTFEKLVIRSQKGASNTVIDAGYQGRHFNMEIDPNTSMDSTFQFIGLTFKGGRSNDRGGSFVIESYSSGFSGGGHPITRPKFVDCIFRDNAAGNSSSNNSSYGEGGAIYSGNANPIFENCVFDSNYATSGGAIYLSGNPESVAYTPTYIRNSKFTDNSASDGGSNFASAQGGALTIGSVRHIIISNSSFTNNSATSLNSSARGGAIYIGSDWDPVNVDEVLIVNTRLSRNVAASQSNGTANGGAIYIGGPTILASSVIDSNFAIISSPNYSAMGGGIFVDQFPLNKNGGSHRGFVEMLNNTLVNNIVTGQFSMGGGFMDVNIDQHDAAMFNNIVWGNRSENSNEPVDGVAIGTSNGNPVSSTDWSDYNNIQDIEEIKSFYGIEFGENTISVDPNFKGEGNYQLADSSPMIGAGTPKFHGHTSPPIQDILGNKRPLPAGSNPDLGAYENSLAESPYPDQVRNVIAEERSKSVKLKWSANNAQNIKHYNVYYSLGKTTNRNELTKATSTTDTVYTVSNLINGTEYHFVISAVDTLDFEGPFSSIVTAIPKFDGPNWWVNANAATSGDGSYDAPFKYIQDAVSRVKERGDTIRLQSGTYEETFLSFSATDQSGGQPGGQPGEDLHQHLIKEIAIIGSGIESTIVDASYGGSHFSFNELEKVLIRGITFTKGFSNSYGGSLQTNNVDSLVVKNVVFNDNNSEQGGGAVALNGGSAHFTNVLFSNNRVTLNNDDQSGLGGAIVLFNGGQSGQGQNLDYSDAAFINCIFQENGITSDRAGAQGFGGVLHANDGTGFEIISSRFERNYIDLMNGSSFASALINIDIDGSAPSWNDYPTPVISQSLFDENYIESFDVHSSLINTRSSLEFNNNLVINNFVGGKGANTMFSLSSDRDQSGTKATSHIVNNTFYGNGGNGSFLDVTGSDEYVNVINNIIWANNKGENQSSNLYQASGTTLYVETNIFESDVSGSFTSVNNINEDPKLRNPASGDFRLQGNSPAVDAGVETGDVFDYRGYYRVGAPDIGAFESGASKYILAIQDDIVGDKDTTFVTREDTLEFTITTNDIEGNLVNSNESVQWSVFPSAKYVTIISFDPTTSGGSATAKFKVSDQARSKGFRFRIEAEVGEGIMRSEMYVIEELVTGAPPPVPSLTITPSDWTTDPNFTISWTIPTWSENRDLLGAIVEINDGINFYDEFIGFPGNTPLKAYAFEVPEPGAFDASVRLMDEYGNEDPDSAKTIQALYDDVNPAPFQINGPHAYTDQDGNTQTNWMPDVPRFTWQNFSDYPSGIKSWTLYLNDAEFGVYFEEDVEFVEQDAAIEDTSKRLDDGKYEWYIKATDYANNSTNSDTGEFGVDLNPPLIIHNNPLTSVDEGSTTPSINVQVSDGGSGVRDVFLNYRRSGTNSGFVTVQLWSDGDIIPSSIPGNDIRSEGVEYFIEAIDELGNRSEWPYDYNGNDVQSVVARTQNNVTTADYWSAGIPTGTDTSAYQLFSIPFKTNKGLNAVTEVLGPPDEFKYRLYSYHNGFEEFTETNSIDMSLGNSYFFIWDKDQYPDILQLNFDFGKGESTPTSPPFEIPAAVGEWKFFGNPYNFPVDLFDVRTQGDLPVVDGGSIYTWSNFGGWVSPGPSLEPWKGYIYKSATEPDIYVDGTGNVFGKKLAKTKTPDLHSIALDANEWMINILASTGRSRDESNTVGVINRAKDGYDPLDEFEPPVVPGNISLAIDNRDRVEVPDLFSVDIRRANEEGHYWDLEVLTPTNGQKTYITFEGLGYVPEKFDVFLINKTNKQAQNLRWESTYRFANAGSKSYLKQNLRLVIGSKEFVQENNAGISLYPDAFVLSQNYPNPFNPQTSIMISLEEDAQVDLVIYSLLGEEVVRLASNEFRPAGYYNFIWNGLNTSGLKVSTGVYLYHAMVRDKNGKTVLNKTKKMVYLK